MDGDNGGREGSSEAVWKVGQVSLRLLLAHRDVRVDVDLLVADRHDQQTHPIPEHGRPTFDPDDVSGDEAPAHIAGVRGPDVGEQTLAHIGVDAVRAYDEVIFACSAVGKGRQACRATLLDAGDRGAEVEIGVSQRIAQCGVQRGAGQRQARSARRPDIRGPRDAQGFASAIKDALGRDRHGERCNRASNPKSCKALAALPGR